jgi:hypothetical protein
MFELFSRARWDQAHDFLQSGDPPMMLRILGINTIFVIIYIIRRARSPHRLNQSTVFQVQALLLLANFLILFQRDIQRLLDRFI